DIRLLGEHNLQNVCAATTAFWQASQDLAAIRQVLTTFSGLEHRLEFVRELGNVRYYDDSFGTTPITSVVAMRALPQPKVMVLGGHDKGLDLSPMIDEVIRAKVRHVIVVGDL